MVRFDKPIVFNTCMLCAVVCLMPVVGLGAVEKFTGTAPAGSLYGPQPPGPAARLRIGPVAQ